MSEISNDARGRVARVVLVTHYPDGDIQAVPVNVSRLKLIMFDEHAIKARLSELGVDLSQWNTGDWTKNPSVLMEQKDGIVILYCQKTGHDHEHGCNGV